MKVLTLPSNISSNPVYSEISLHLKPNFLIDLNVPPELIIFILFFFKTFKTILRFSLSETDIKSVFYFTHFIFFLLFPN